MGPLQFRPVFARLPYLLGGAGETLALTSISFLFGLMVALALAIARTEGRRPLRTGADWFITVTTNTPQLSQIFAIFYCLPLLGLGLSPFVSVMTGMSLNAGAYMANIVGAEMRTIPAQIHEAAETLGLGLIGRYRHVIVPHALQRARLSLENHFLIMLLGSSMASIFGVEELTGRAYNVIATSFRSVEVITVTALLYILLSLLAAGAFKRLQRFL
jgi:polar amino acid transport system permease protein